MPRLLPLSALLPLLAALALAGQPPMPKEQPKKLTAEEKTELEAQWKAANDAGGTAYQAGKIGDAMKAYAEGLALARRLYQPADLPNGHANLALSLNNLGQTYQALGKAADAEPLFKDCLAMRRRLHGNRDHADVARSLTHLGRLYLDLDRLADAEAHCRDAVAMYGRLFKGRSHRDIAYAQSQLAGVCLKLGKRAEAEQLLKAALAMRKSLFPGDHRDVANSLGDLGLVYRQSGRLADAEPLYRDALAMWKRLSPDGDHPEVAKCMTSLGVLYRHLGKPTDAEPLLKDALAMQKRLFKGDHPAVANSLSSLGDLHRHLGDMAAAEPPLRDALAMRKRLYPGDHQTVADSLTQLGWLDQARGRAADAERSFNDALVMRQRLLDAAAMSQSEDDQIALRASFRHLLDSWLAVGGGRPATGRYAEVLGWKGSAYVRQVELRAAAQAANDPVLNKLIAERAEVARRIANLTYVDLFTERSDTLKKLADRQEEIEREVARKSEPFRKARAAAARTPELLAKALPADVALVDYLEYSHSTPHPDKKGQWADERRFLAFVVRNGKPVVEVELKASAPIAESVAAWRQAIERGAGIGGKDDPAAVLRKLVWEPVAKHIGDAKTVLVAPDGVLSRLPFAAMPGSDPKKYLLEEVALAVVPVPQLLPELLSAKSDAGAKPSLLVVGGVDFDADAGAPAPGTSAWAAAIQAKNTGKWAALAGTSDEAKAVANAFAKQFPEGQATTLTGKGATEAGVREAITGRRVLHFATHGFFAPPPPEPEKPTPVWANGYDPRLGGGHPGLKSGLVLAGANNGPKLRADDGILTAREVAGLDLRGVELAVLSACETGLGKEASGEGVLGLQRAFQAAGARAVVSSLWKVPDQSTAALMGRFYQHLWADKLPAAEALRRAQLELLRNPDRVAGWAKAFRGATADDGGKVEATDGRLPPRAWAAFTLSGDWR